MRASGLVVNACGSVSVSSVGVASWGGVISVVAVAAV